MNTSSISTRLEDFFTISDYVPLLSTPSNLTILFYKYVTLPKKTQDEIDASHFYKYVQDKSTLRCVVLTIPVVGQLLVLLHNLFTQKKNPPVVNNDTPSQPNHTDNALPNKHAKPITKNTEETELKPKKPLSPLETELVKAKTAILNKIDGTKGMEQEGFSTLKALFSQFEMDATLITGIRNVIKETKKALDAKINENSSEQLKFANLKKTFEQQEKKLWQECKEKIKDNTIKQIDEKIQGNNLDDLKQPIDDIFQKLDELSTQLPPEHNINIDFASKKITKQIKPLLHRWEKIPTIIDAWNFTQTTLKLSKEKATAFVLIPGSLQRMRDCIETLEAFNERSDLITMVAVNKEIKKVYTYFTRFNKEGQEIIFDDWLDNLYDSEKEPLRDQIFKLANLKQRNESFIYSVASEKDAYESFKDKVEQICRLIKMDLIDIEVTMNTDNDEEDAKLLQEKTDKENAQLLQQQFNAEQEQRDIAFAQSLT